MSAPRVSVVLVTWNVRERASKLLDAIDELAVLPREVIVVDNASTDGTPEELLARSRAGSRAELTVVLNATNRQCAAGTNQALALARGEYVVYLCATHAAVTGRGWDATLVAFMDEHPELVLAGDAWNPYGFLLPSRRYRDGWTPERHGAERLLHVQGGAWIARRSVFETVGGFAEDEYPQGGMDVELSYRLLSHGLKLGRHPVIAAPPAPEVPARRAGVVAYHPAPR